MARINIEDSLFKDARFLDLCIHYGDKQKALGSIVWAFITAQKFYLDQLSDRLIPLSEWKRQGCDDKLIDFGFAEKRDQGIYVCGSEKQFAWLIQRVEAGRKGGLGGRHIYSNMTDEQRKLREKARKAVSNAVQRNRIIKPTVCEGCGIACNPEAHHSDYTKPFEISWVCKKCHHEIHDKLLGTKESGEAVAVVKRDEAVAKPLSSFLFPPPLSSLLSSQTQTLVKKKKNTLAQSDESLQADAYPKSFNDSQIKFFIERRVSSKLVTALVNSFPDQEWLTHEIRKAATWEIANPKRRKKDFGRFLTNWLNKGWDSRRISTNKNEQIEKNNDVALNELLKKYGEAK